MSIVTFTPEIEEHKYNENENFNLNISFLFELSPEELTEIEEDLTGEIIPNYIVSKELIISPVSEKVNIVNNETSWSLSGYYNLDDFIANIYYVDKGKSDKNQTPEIALKYSEVPDNKDIFRIHPVETEKTFNITVTLTDYYDIQYIKTYNLIISIKNDSISNWAKNYFKERY